MTEPFAPTHAVPDDGLATWPEPDPAQPQGPRLAGRLPLQVTRTSGAWAKVVCSNGWTGWVDGRRLVTGPPAPARAGARLFVAAPVASTAPLRVGRVTVSAPLVGSALAAVGVLLDWVSAGTQGRNSFDVPLSFLWDQKAQPGGLNLGLVLALLVALGVAAALRPLPGLARQVSGWGLLGVATVFVGQLQRLVGQPEAAMVFGMLGLGVYLTAAGGLVILLGRGPGEANGAKR